MPGIPHDTDIPAPVNTKIFLEHLNINAMIMKLFRLKTSRNVKFMFCKHTSIDVLHPGSTLHVAVYVAEERILGLRVKGLGNVGVVHHWGCSSNGKGIVAS